MTALTDERRITAQHLRRSALVYARQSSPDQVRTHAESTRLQRGLVERAEALGWPRAELIDEDLGVSAAGYAERLGFQRMLALVATGQAGILLCLDASRLSRNSPDFARLFQLCAYFDTLVADLTVVYDLSMPDDRMVLGIKAVVSEMELQTLKLRMRSGIESKASRGEFRFMLPAGYVHDTDDRIVLDPDRRVREAIEGVFAAFGPTPSIRQLALQYQDNRRCIPVRENRGKRGLRWVVPTPATLIKILTNPIYAGAYVWGRSHMRVEFKGGQLRKRQSGRNRSPEEARVFIPDHHLAYISWEQFLANQARIAENRARWKMADNKGAVRSGEALLTGVVRCGHCGRRMRVSYSGNTPVYFCAGNMHGEGRNCLSIGAVRLDKMAGEALCRVVSPLAIEVATEAEALRAQDQERIAGQARSKVQAMQYEANRALEQYQLVDPKNRLVADTLEERLEQRLQDLRAAQEDLRAILSRSVPLTDADRQQLVDLGSQFPAVWNHPATARQLQKQIVRAVIEEVVLTHRPDEQAIDVLIHWRGGTHTRYSVHKRRGHSTTKQTGPLLDAVRSMALNLSDTAIARVLNRNALTTPTGLPWTFDRVREFRDSHAIPEGSADPDTLSANHAAQLLGIAWATLERLVRDGVIHRQQVLPYAPWRIDRTEIEPPSVQKAISRLKQSGASAHQAEQLSLLAKNTQPEETKGAL